MRIFYLCFLLFFLVSCRLDSQTGNSGVISGYITDSTNGKNLSNAIAYLEKYNIGAATNMDGYFIIPNAPAGKQTLIVGYIGFKTLKKMLIVHKGENNVVNINLKPIYLHTNEIIINSDSGSSIKKLFMKPISNIELTSEQINNIPGLAEADLLRSLQTIPGIKSISDYSSMPYIRGGTPDQNLYLIDGTIVYNPEHAFGMFSTFNSSAIKKVELSKGGFGAEYGGRLSSVMNVTTIDGKKNNFYGNISLSLLSGSFALQIPMGNFGSISGSFRRTYLDQTAAKFIDAIPPYYFLDGNFKTVLNISSQNKITLSLFGSRDNLDYIFNKQAKEKVGFLYDWKNITGSFNWNWIITRNLLAGFTLSESKYSSQFNFDEIGMKEINNLEDYTLRGNLEYFCPKYFTFRLGYENKLINNLLYEDLSSEKINIIRRIIYQSGYLTAEWKPSANWNIETGLRFDSFNSQKEYTNLDPRFSIKYRLTESSNIKFSTGLYHQYITRIPRMFIASILTSADKYTPGSLAYHFITSFQQEIGNSFTLEIESYLKEYKNIYQFNQNFLADVETGYYTNDNKPIIVESNGLFNRGDGKSYGIELLLRKDYGAVTGWFGYTLSRTEFKFDGLNNGISFVPRYDRTSTVNLNTAVDFIYLYDELSNDYHDPASTKLLIGINFLYATGQPFTVPSSVYSAQKLPDWTGNQYNVSLYASELNTKRLPSYLRLDFSLTYVKRYKGWSLAPYIQIFNLGNRKNIWFLNYDVEIIDNKITQEIKNIYMLPVLPSVGININF